MPSPMISQMPLGGETHITICKITPKRLLPVMNPHVSKQISFLSESLLTAFHLANKWPLSCL